MFSYEFYLTKFLFVPGFVGVLLGVLNQHLEEPPNVRKSTLRYFIDYLLNFLKPHVNKCPNPFEKRNLKKQGISMVKI
jgi:hypothetical protein